MTSLVPGIGLVGTAFTCIFFLIFPSHSLAAELWLRESLVKKHARDILVTIHAVPDHIGKRAHPLKEGCDLDVPLRSEDINVPILGKIKNACSYPEGITSTYWSNRLKSLEGHSVEVEGVLRVWLGHPPKGGKIQCECDGLPLYANSNPDHMVEIHPLTRLGSISFLSMTREIQKGGDPYVSYLGGKISSTLNKRRITIRRVQKAGETYLAIKGPRTGYDHWTVLAVVMSIAEERRGGHAFDVGVIQRKGFMERNLLALTIKGTPADAGVETLQVNDEVVLFGIVRLDLALIEKKARQAWRTIPMPYELIVLDIMR
ncbi:MAG: hypothetical protein IH919_10060 [Deltaproteobacteria bacterium]|nr:hypothetical protein [Deltaproteobacteria bacterium]